jgi:NADH-quinone oxidoreductase subunit L
MIDLVWLVPVLPVAGVVFCGLLGRFVGKRAISFVACGVVGLSFLVSLAVLKEFLGSQAAHAFQVKLLTWIPAGDFKVNFALQVDALSVLMICVVSGVGFLIHVYSAGYMWEDDGFSRYFAYLNLFMASMLTLVLANNFLLLYVGWEAVGLCSYLLIGFWFRRKAAADAGRKAFMVNRVGDAGFLLGIILIFLTFRSLDFGAVFSRLGGAPSSTLTIIALLLLLGATGKSAQIPLYVWLPDAMEGPTPVSALIHAATMVTAGVYMVARCHLLFWLAPWGLAAVAVIGAVTAVFAASIGLVQNDMKRVLAYSTISQIGYMMLGCGVGAFSSAMFHLTTHAFFKALLFLAAGSVMHALHGEVDIRRMGNLRRSLPLTYACFAIGAAALSGVPLFSGFFSKDEILWHAWESERGAEGLWLLGIVGAAMTSFYIWRLVFRIFWGEAKHEGHAHEAPASMAIPLVVLAGLSAVGGFIGVPGRSAVEHFLSPVFKDVEAFPAARPGTETTMMFISVIVALFGIWLAWRAYVAAPGAAAALARRFPATYGMLRDKYRVDELYGATFVRPGWKLAQWLWDFFDTKVIDGAANGTAGAVARAGSGLRLWESGYVTAYALATLAGATALLAWLLWR